MPKQNSYNFSQTPPQQKPGFSTFEDKSGSWRFLYNDQAGVPLLFSKGYATKKKCREGLNVVRRNYSDPDRYKTVEADAALHFVIRAGNNREISRSRPFKSRTELNKKMKQLLQRASGLREEPPKKTSAGKEDSSGLKKNMSEKTSMDNRFKFNLTFRRAGKNEPLRGEIDYPLTKEKTTFKGLDLNTLATFISRHLPEEIAKKLPELPANAPEAPMEPTALPNAEASRTEKQEETVKAELQSAPQLPAVKPLNFVILHKNWPDDSQVFRQSDQAEIRIPMTEQEDDSWKTSQGLYRLTVSACPLDKTREAFVISHKQGVLPADGNIVIPLQMRHLRPGLYRLSSSLNLINGSKKNKPDNRKEGSKIVQVF